MHFEFETAWLAEHLAPCVLWIDEIVKGLATGGDDGGTARRMPGTLLTWLAARTVVAI